MKGSFPDCGHIVRAMRETSLPLGGVDVCLFVSSLLCFYVEGDVCWFFWDLLRVLG